MEITPAYDHDFPEMIALLKRSLGEDKIPITEHTIRWKHFQNPFGQSAFVLAREQGAIIGLRAFMRWTWQTQTETIHAVRAVDTATDPAHQGKGIFKTLTMNAVEACTREGVSFVFNSPNEKSRPGYLKMGWKITGKMPLHMGIGSLLPVKYQEARLQEQMHMLGAAPDFSGLDPAWVFPPDPVFFQTPLSTQYLNWRYRDCPIFNYHALVDPGLFGIVFGFRPRKGFIELRICEAWTHSAAGVSASRASLKQLLRTVRPMFVTCAPTPTWAGGQQRPFGLPGPFLMGPITTLRPLAMQNLPTFEKFSGWKPSIGSMELF
jgi:GNAT superfamily N-acetyltransferase